MKITRRDALCGAAALTALAVPVSAFSAPGDDAELIEKAREVLRMANECNAPGFSDAEREALYGPYDAALDELLAMPASTPAGLLAKLEASEYCNWVHKFVHGDAEVPLDCVAQAVVRDLLRMAGGEFQL